ncbi:hypothetical protein DRN74_04770 [Candidatus Micrarchaeota archaeon]|nr:MAG: hypothetical protein DRN74_04770 [Candidatus Micrarchaeota archaeon]
MKKGVTFTPKGIGGEDLRMPKRRRTMDQQVGDYWHLLTLSQILHESRKIKKMTFSHQIP